MVSNNIVPIQKSGIYKLLQRFHDGNPIKDDWYEAGRCRILPEDDVKVISLKLNDKSGSTTWKSRWCVPPVVRYWAMADDNIYRGLSSVGNLRISTPRGRYHRLLHGMNALTSPMRKEPITDMSHLVVISSYALLLTGSVTRSRKGV